MKIIYECKLKQLTFVKEFYELIEIKATLFLFLQYLGEKIQTLEKNVQFNLLNRVKNSAC